MYFCDHRCPGAKWHQDICSQNSESMYFVYLFIFKTHILKVENERTGSQDDLNGMKFKPCHAGPVYGKYKASLWPQMPRCQVGAKPSVTILVFHVQCSIPYYP